VVNALSFYLADKAFGPILESQFNQYTPENEMKWEVVHPSRDTYNSRSPGCTD
jgi:endo-1,4-beta-xylanase